MDLLQTVLLAIWAWASGHVTEIVTMIGILLVARNTRSTLRTTRELATDKSETDAEIAYRNRRYTTVCDAYKTADLALLNLKDRLNDFSYPKTSQDRDALDEFMQTSFLRASLNDHKAALGPAGSAAVNAFSTCWLALQERGFRYVADGVDLAEIYDQTLDMWTRGQARDLMHERNRRADVREDDPDDSYQRFAAQMERDLGV